MRKRDLKMMKLCGKLLKPRSLLACLLTVSLVGPLMGCAPKPGAFVFTPYSAKSLPAPEVKYCFDTIGHKRGTYPFILGGTCCCTPTQKLLDIYHEDGFLLDYDLERLLAEYRKRGIVIRHKDNRMCNNCCDKGPHIVFGGHCMVPPTPGTANFERVAHGIGVDPEMASRWASMSVP